MSLDLSAWPTRVWSMRLSEDSAFYQVIRYPAGEMQVRLRPEWRKQNPGAVQIVARQLKGDWVTELALLKSAVDSLGPSRVDLVIPYLPYARADRRFVPGDCFGIQVLGSLLRSMRFDRVLTLDAHSSVAGEHVDNLCDVPADHLIAMAVSRFASRCKENRITAIFPDEGAAKRYRLPDIKSNIGGFEVLRAQCAKKRDVATGRLLGFEVPEVSTTHAIIIDDICDGGGTFLGIADRLPGHVLGLYVTHGIFSQGFGELKKRFEVVYTTDSFKDVSTLDACVFDSVHATVSGRIEQDAKTR